MAVAQVHVTEDVNGLIHRQFIRLRLIPLICTKQDQHAKAENKLPTKIK